MQNRFIIIDVELADSTQKKLRLSAHNCKQEFKEFVHTHNLSKHDSFALKNIVQTKLIKLYRLSHSSAISPSLQPQRPNQQSPRFRVIEKQFEKDKPSPQVHAKKGAQNEAKVPVQSETKLLEQSELHIFGMSKQPMMSASHSLPTLKQYDSAKPYEPIAEEQQQAPKQSVSPHQYQFEEPKKLHAASQESQSTQAYLNPKNETTKDKKQQSYFKQKTIPQKLIKKIDFQPQKIHPCFSRLYKAETDSFKSKRAQQIDHKEAKDYLQVEKYLLANNLKRVSPKVHQQLHKKSTESSRAKYTPQKIKQFAFSTPQTQKEFNAKKQQPKNSSGKTFKGSQWKSGSRCEKNLLIAQQQKRRNSSKQRQRFIRQRMLENKDKSPLEQHDEYRSRSCEKCSPKKAPQKKEKKAQIKIQHSQRVKRPYINNLLLQSYQQFYKGIHPLKSQKPKR